MMVSCRVSSGWTGSFWTLRCWPGAWSRTAACSRSWPRTGHKCELIVSAVQLWCVGCFGVLPASASGSVAGEAEDAGEFVLDGAGLGEHAVGSGPAAVALAEQHGLADAA